MTKLPPSTMPKSLKEEVLPEIPFKLALSGSKRSVTPQEFKMLFKLKWFWILNLKNKNKPSTFIYQSHLKYFQTHHMTAKLPNLEVRDVQPHFQLYFSLLLLRNPTHWVVWPHRALFHLYTFAFAVLSTPSPLIAFELLPFPLSSIQLLSPPLLSSCFVSFGC